MTYAVKTLKLGLFMFKVSQSLWLGLKAHLWYNLRCFSSLPTFLEEFMDEL